MLGCPAHLVKDIRKGHKAYRNAREQRVARPYPQTIKQLSRLSDIQVSPRLEEQNDIHAYKKWENGTKHRSEQRIPREYRGSILGIRNSEIIQYRIE